MGIINDLIGTNDNELENDQNTNTETNDNESSNSPDNSNDSIKYIKQISEKIGESFDNDTPLLSLIQDKENTCSKEYAINNIDIYKSKNLKIDLLFNDEYDLNNDGQITQDEIDLIEKVFKKYSEKSILDQIIENFNTCSQEYKNEHSNYESEGLHWPHSIFNVDEFEDKYDLNNDGKITIDDYNIACKIIDLNNKLLIKSKSTILNSLSSLPELPNSISNSLESIMAVLGEKFKLTMVNTKNIENIPILSDTALDEFKKYYMNICSQEYALKNPNYRKEGLTIAQNQYAKQALNSWDFNNDNKLTQEDYDLAIAAKAKAMNIFDVIYDISLSLHDVNNNLGSSSYLNDKKLFFRQCILQLFVNVNFDYNPKPTKMVINDCLQRAKIFTDEVFNTRI